MTAGLRLAGVSHRTADVALRERLAIPAGRLGEAYAALKGRGARGAVILSTCNRVEVYAEAADGILPAFLASFHGLPAEALSPHLYAKADAEAARHAFEVAAGLDALALGETQILGQAKEAYLLAREHDMASPALHALFQKAFAAAKRVHTETALGQRRTSVSSVAVDLAGKIFQDLADRTALVVGAGEMSELTVRHLAEAGLKRLVVANRTLERAEALAKPYGGTAAPLSALAEILPRADILISSAGGDGCLVTAEMVREALKRRRQQPLFLIDIAVPRNVHPDVKGLDNVYAYDIDDLEKVVAENVKGREEEAGAAKAIVDAAVLEFLHEHLVRSDLQPVITALRDRLHSLREKELERVPASARAETEEAMNRLVNKILHDPIETLKAEAADGNGVEVAKAIRKLFRL